MGLAEAGREAGRNKLKTLILPQHSSLLLCFILDFGSYPVAQHCTVLSPRALLSVPLLEPLSSWVGSGWGRAHHA